ncbi:MAG: phosphoglycolate phosphatase [Crenarchaeota archaeon]|nr:phosphoglycolate phosphatase [Thermoproteota archaeon]
MDLSSVKVVAADVDGTLTEGVSFLLSLEAIRALRELERAGIKVILVSGNSRPITLTLKRYLGTTAPVVYENGCGCGDYSWEDYVVERNMCMLAKEAADMLLKVLSVKGWKPSWQNPWRRCDFAINAPGGEASEEDAQKAYQILDELGYIKQGLVVMASRHAVHIMPKGCGKGKGVRRVVERLGYEMKDVLAVGDAENDVDMIKEAGIGVAVADAQEVLKRVADIVAPEPAGRGFAWIAKKVLEARSSS